MVYSILLNSCQCILTRSPFQDFFRYLFRYFKSNPPNIGETNNPPTMSLNYLDNLIPIYNEDGKFFIFSCDLTITNRLFIIGRLIQYVERQNTQSSQTAQHPLTHQYQFILN